MPIHDLPTVHKLRDPSEVISGRFPIMKSELALCYLRDEGSHERFRLAR